MSVLSVILGLNATRFRSGFAGAASYAQRFGTALRGAMLTALGPIALAMQAIEFLRDTFQDANKVADLSDRYRVNEEALQRLATVGKRVGLEMEDVARLLKDLNKAMAMSIADPKKREMFERLGISAEEMRNGTLSATDAVFRISAALDGTANKSEILLALYELLGRSGETLATILNKSDEEIRRLFNSAEVLSAQQIEAADQLGDAFDGATEVLKKMGMWIITFLAMIAGVVSELAVGIFQIFVNIGEGIFMVLKNAFGFLEKLLKAVGFDFAAQIAGAIASVHEEQERAAENLDRDLDARRAKIKDFTDQMVAATFGFDRSSGKKKSREGGGLDVESLQKRTSKTSGMAVQAIQAVGGGGIASGPNVQSQILDVARRQLDEQKRTNEILQGQSPKPGTPATSGGSPSGDDIFDIFNFNPR